MKQSDKEFLCYLICLSWDRLDDLERIRASKIIRELTDKEDDVPKVEYVNAEILSRRSKVNTVPDPLIFRAEFHGDKPVVFEPKTEVPADDISAREDVKKWYQFNDPFDYNSDKEE